MNTQLVPLFQSYLLNNGVEIKNRLVVAPMTHLASDDNGQSTPEELDFIRERADGFGMFISAATAVQAGARAFPGQPNAIGLQDLDSLKAVAAAIQSQGAKALLQLHHGGHQALRMLTGDCDVVAPSATENAREMSAEEVAETIAAFGRATELAIAAGFDGVEIHGANGYLVQQFYSEQSNRREDEWGGSQAKRLRFPLAVVDAVCAAKAKASNEAFIIGYRFSPEEPGEQGLTMEDTFVLIDALLTKPLQYLHISLWDYYKLSRRGADATRTRMALVHEHIGGKLPLIGVGNLYNGEQIAAAYAEGWAEFLALGKTVLMNPHIARQLAEGAEGDIETVLDPAKGAAHYHLPARLWAMSVSGEQAWLPPVKGKAYIGIDL